LTLLKRHERRVEAAEIFFFLVSVVGNTSYDHETNEEIREEMNIYNLNEIMWIVHASGHNIY
jgi:hypothetical protein